MAFQEQALIFLVFVFGLLVYRWASHRRRAGGLPYPPGPKGDPIIGNLRQLPDGKKEPVHITYKKWSKIYGDVFSIESFGTRVVVLNTAHATNELLEKRGNIYSDRNPGVIRRLSTDHHFPSMDYNEEFRTYRKVVNAAFNPTAVKDYHDIQEQETYECLEHLLESPDQWFFHMRRAAGSIILRVTYDHKVTSNDDRLVEINEAAVLNNLRSVTPTAFVVNFVPWLQYMPDWFPGTGYRPFVKEVLDGHMRNRNTPWVELKERMAKGAIKPCYASRLLEMKGQITGSDDEEYIIKASAGILYSAAVDTTLGTMASFVLAMLLYPECQKKLQVEIDSVVGKDRLPTFADEDRLPYVRYCVLETLRWMPVVPLGLSHASTQDDIYEGMFIPKGSIIVANQWAILHDESMYPEPMKFWPERWDGRFPQARDSRLYAFGFNRRMCPGRHLAYRSVFIMAANLVSAFTLMPDEKSPLPENFSLSAGQTFKCQFAVRSPEKAALVRSTASTIDSN
ncbi:cytochrome P450 [Neolentinus lepideus HHB14362 ss-1]|uniref:Cytochrome P450 n=1 Tax=Neolentinus lepideus HHB14362 ss-1 TaxID=1314782 RepID=A0A165R6B3_9AGAM|nr:cytochrome P450 [Neolentinus lepideus HHB14362 ss-1]